MRTTRRILWVALATACAPAPSSDDAPRADTDDAGTSDTDRPADTDVTFDTDAAAAPGDDFDLHVLDATHVFFTGSQNARTIDVDATFPPATSTYADLRLDMAVACPTGGRCDPWDRLAWFGVVLDKGTPDERVVELTRFVTPYGVGDTWSLDVTDLRPLLTGPVHLRVFIDTWVGPGSPYGDGWKVDAHVVGTGGVPPRDVRGVLAVFPPSYVAYGDPARPPADQLPAVEVPLPTGTDHLALRTFITGHGQGSRDNCAEFCERRHAIDVGGATFTRRVWRADCQTTGAPNQQGTWTYARAGWCPGAEVLPWVVDLTAPATPTVSIAWDVAPYENTCRPDAPTCSGCVNGNGCAYDGGGHTEPNYQVGAALIAYGP